MERPVTTLFMLMSADGKIITGSADVRQGDVPFDTLIPFCIRAAFMELLAEINDFDITSEIAI